MECLTPTVSFHLSIDNYFASFCLFCLLTHLGVNNIRARGVVNKNSLCKYTIIGDKQLQKKELDHFQQRNAHQAKMLFSLCGWSEWQEGALHSFFWILPTYRKFVRRWNKVERKVYSRATIKSIPLLQPEDEFCQKNGSERVQTQDWYRIKQWWWYQFVSMLDVVLQGAWILYWIN